MKTVSAGQALRSAMEAETAEAHFYERLAEQSQDPRAKRFLLELVGLANHHSQEIQAMGRQLVGHEIADQSSYGQSASAEQQSWGLVQQSITFEQALQLAIDCKTHASRYYGVLADYLEGPAALFFRALSHAELQHAQMVQSALAKAPEIIESDDTPRLQQVIEGIFALENEAAQFYQECAERSPDPSARKFFLDMIEVERDHASELKSLHTSLRQGALSEMAFSPLEVWEPLPNWHAPADLNNEGLLHLARQAEQATARYYRALAGHVPPYEAKLLVRMAETEEEHARMIWDALRYRHFSSPR